MVRIINIDTKTRTIRVSNGKDDLEWFTTDTGSHVPLKKGQSKAEAIKEHFGDKKSDTKRVAAKIYSKLADRVGYVSDSDLEKYLDDNEYFNDDVREEIVKTVRKLESQASERHSEKDAPKPTEQWQNPRPRGKYIEHEMEQIIEKQSAKQGKGTDENGTVWIKMGGAIIPLRDGVSADEIDPKMLATPEEIKQGRAKYDGIKDRQDAAREKAKSGRTYADVIDEENWEELSRKYLRDFGGGKKLNHVELNSLMNGDKLDIIEKRKVREAMRKIGGLEE